MSVNLRALVLNMQYLPLSLFPLYTIPVEEAISRYLNGTCTVVYWYDRTIKTPSRNDLKWPSVIANHNFYSYKKSVRISKETLYYLYDGKCNYCGKELTVHTVTKDHIIPTSKGGKHTFDNVISCCAECNAKKGDEISPTKWKPLHQPRIPSFYEMLQIRSKYPIVVDDESWVQFLPNWTGDIRIRGRD